MNHRGAFLDSSELFQQGDLASALEAALTEVRQKPTDVPARLFLAELCCFSGDWERAEKQLDTLSKQTTDAAMLVALFRQLLRGEIARQQVLVEGRTPEIVTPLTPAMSKAIEILNANRNGDLAKATELVAEMDSLQPLVTGTCNDKPFESIRDLDDRTAPILEVITSTGKYFWTPWESLEYLDFDPPLRAMDLLWRRTKISVKGGPEGEVYIPTRYVSANDTLNELQRLSRATDWIGEEGEFTQGLGCRTLLVGEESLTIMELKSLTFDEREPLE